ncbi:MAG: WYL domain-containing protein [Gemmatimonadaceae bacterium]|nr:WYL domain-containing protein [Gemmatimonadaceae bacterium]
MPKLQRWIDLLAALLGHRMPVTFKELAKDVPAYLSDGSVDQGNPSPTLKRMFERDKLELLEFGVPIVSIGEDGSDESAYALRTKDFYLPYLGVVSARGLERPAKVDRYGYHSLGTLAFEPDELEAIAQAAQRVTRIGDPTLADEARNAMRKLAFDLPLGATDSATEDVVVSPRTRPDPRILSALGDALFRRKRVSFAYHAMNAGATARRSVEPYGLFFTSGHWYLAARDTDKSALRNFRVSRIEELETNVAKSGTPDFEIPTEFSLREHARSRQAWELGDGDVVDGFVEFSGTTGAVIAAAALGAPDESSPKLRRFKVRRTDSFARWLLSFAGDAVPVAPPALVAEYRAMAERTRDLYAGGAT